MTLPLRWLRLGCALLPLLGSVSRAEVIIRDEGGRVRFGGSAQIGPALDNATPGILGRGEVRLGYQLSRQVSVFALTAFGFTTSGSLYGTRFDLGAVAEVLPVDWFYLGAGVVSSFLGSYYGTRDSVRFAVDLRLGFSTGTSRPPFFDRPGLHAGLHVLLLTGSSVVVVPMLAIGFDLR